MEDDPLKKPALGNVNTCTGKMEIPTPREREALTAMKSNKERAREIKRRLEELNALEGDVQVEETGSLKEELARLKQAWKLLEIERDAAARERMILLGHETEDSTTKS